MRACLEVSAHYIDLGGLFHITRKQFELQEEFAAAGLTAVLGMGSTPRKLPIRRWYDAPLRAALVAALAAGRFNEARTKAQAAMNAANTIAAGSLTFWPTILPLFHGAW